MRTSLSLYHPFLFRLLFPNRCRICGRFIGEKKYRDASPDIHAILCDSCLRDLPRTEQALIRQNSTEMTLLQSASPFVRDQGQAMLAAQRVMHLQRAAAFLFFEKDYLIRAAIHRMKYGDEPMIGYLLGRQAAEEFMYTDFFDGIELIVPVPLHPNRLRERGYNQSEYIAAGISEATGIPLDTTHVLRIKDTPKQALQSGIHRRHNVADAFAVSHPEQLYRKHILLVDDLLTTGETVKSCLKAMRTIRRASFSVFALCKAQ